MIRDGTTIDAEIIRDIYNIYVIETQVTFAEKPLSLNEIESQIQTITGKGIVSKLKKAMTEELKNRGFHSGISLPNPASIAMCEKFGFQKIAHFKEVGNKFGKWIDVGHWRLILKKPLNTFK